MKKKSKPKKLNRRYFEILWIGKISAAGKKKIESFER